MNPAGQPAGQPAQPRAVGSGRLWAELWEALGELWERLYTKTPDQPHQRPLCYVRNVGLRYVGEVFVDVLNVLYMFKYTSLLIEKMYRLQSYS